MFDRYLIGEDSLRNWGSPQAPAGFLFRARLGYYRGLGLSMVEDLSVVVDGDALPRSAIRFSSGGVRLTLDEMESAYDRRWGFGEWAEIAVEKVGGLRPGEHRLALVEKLRISYLPYPLLAKDEKLVLLQPSFGK